MTRPLVVALALAAWLAAWPATAGVTQQVSVGARAIGMGGAFSSIADDATAPFWNPAGLPGIGHQEISGTHADLYGASIQDDFISFVLPLSPHHAVASDWYHSGLDDPELNFAENRFDLAYGGQFHSILAVGATAKYLTRTTGLDGTTVRHGGGVGMDLGALARPIRGLALALVAQDVFDTRVDYADGGSTVVYPRNVRLGASYRPRPWGVVAMDLDDRVHLGAEIVPIGPLSLRGGVQWEKQGESETIWSTGIGLKASIFRFDYANELRSDLGTTHYFGLSMQFNFNPSQIRIEGVENKDVYASLYKRYAQEPVALVKVQNLSDRPLSVTFDSYIPELMDAPTERAVDLNPRKITTVPVLVNLSPDKALALPPEEGRHVRLDLSATYQSERLPRTDRTHRSLYAFGRGAINWGDGVDQAAAYVTQQDPVVDQFAGAAAREAALLPETPAPLQNIQTTAAIFDALASCGVAYVADPDNPFGTISEEPHAVDTVRYPRETLSQGKGDCDDTTVLLAALLENVGIATRFVDGPGHIFLLFDSGVHERNRIALCVDPDLTVTADRRVWIPLETTALKDGFAEAWRLGSQIYADWSRAGQATVVDVEAAQQRYQPGQPPSGSSSVPQPDAGRLRSALTRDLERITGWRTEYLAQFRSGADTLAITPEGLEELAHAQLLAGRCKEALALISRTVPKVSTARSAANRGVVLGVCRQWAEAISSLEAALASDPSDRGVEMDLGLVLLAAGQSQRGQATLTRVVSDLGGYSAACGFLKLSSETSPTRQARETESMAELRSALRAAAGAGPWPRTIRLDDRAGDLYWKR